MSLSNILNPTTGKQSWKDVYVNRLETEHLVTNNEATSSTINVEAVTNQITFSHETGNTTVINSVNPSSARIYTIPDAKNNGNMLISTQNTVTQLTNKTTAVTINGTSGVITTESDESVTPGIAITFTVNNSLVAANSVVVACITDYTFDYFIQGYPAISVNNVRTGALI